MSQFREHPKWLHFDGQPSVLVKNVEEERAVLGDTGGPYQRFVVTAAG